MSAPVDVLAVLDRACTALNDEGLFNSGDDLCKARRAVAELIRAVVEMFAADDDKHEKGYRTVGMDLRSMSANERLRAVIARVGGAA